MRIPAPQKVSILYRKPLQWYKNASRKKKIAAITALMLLLIILSQAVGNALKPPPYTLGKAGRSNLSEVVSESGKVTSGNTTLVYSPTNGIIKELHVSNGDFVEEGDVLFTVKSTATPQEQFAAYSNYLTAQAALNAAEASANTLRSDMYAKWKAFSDLATNTTYENDDGTPNTSQRLASEFQIAQDNWVAAEKKYKDQQTAISQTRAQVNSTLLLYDATKNAEITAPMSGTVANLVAVEGGTVSVSTALVQAPPALAIANFINPEVAVALNEIDAAKVRTGQIVAIDVSAIDDKLYRGTVVRVDDIGVENQGVVTYNAYISINNPDARLKSGMTVDVEITTRELNNVLTVPNASVKPYKGGRGVRVIDKKTGKVITIPVQVGIKGESRTQILKGITEDQEVVTALSNEELKRPGLF